MNKILCFYDVYSHVIPVVCLVKVAALYAWCGRIQMVPMSIIGHKSALAELAQASTAFGYDLTEEPLSSQDEINSELREAGGAFTEYFDMMLPDAPAPEILDTKNQKQSDESTPSITIGTVKLYELYGGKEPRNCE
jgi:hypothetical protein